MSEIRRKLVIVGDGACGKTCLLIVFSKGTFPEVSLGIVFTSCDTAVRSRKNQALGGDFVVYRARPSRGRRTSRAYTTGCLACKVACHELLADSHALAPCRSTCRLFSRTSQSSLPCHTPVQAYDHDD